MNRLSRFTLHASRLWLLAVGCLLLNHAHGAELVTATITLTNLPAGLTSNLTVNASTRFWTNSPVGVLSTHIQTTNTIAMSATNLLNHLSQFPPDVGWYFSMSSPTNVTIRARVNQTLTVTLAPSPGWAVVTYVTQQVTTPTYVVRMPITVETATNQTNIASLMTKAISDVSTQAFGTNSTAVSNLLTKGASPTQKIISPVQFDGRVGIGGSLNATNGYSQAVTNINSVSSNHVNYGRALRSDGPGGVSTQLGSNANANGLRTLSLGNNATNSGQDAVLVGIDSDNSHTNSITIGNRSTNRITRAASGTGGNVLLGNDIGADGIVNVGIGFGFSLTNDEQVAVGYNQVNTGYRAITLGSEAQANQAYGIAIGGAATKINGLALGGQSSHSNSAAIGPKDDQGTFVVTTDTNQIVLGTSRHRITSPGLFESPRSTNSQFAGTNIARGSWSFPRFDLTTLAAGNNISVPFGTNVYIRLGSGPASAASICGIIGGATSGGLDGQLVEVFNDTGFSVTFAVNTVDPIAANRINTPLGTDVTIADQASARLMYDGTDSRWKLISPFSVTASATNAVASVFTNGVAVSSAATNINFVQGSNSILRAANSSGNVTLTINDERGSRNVFVMTNLVTVTNTTNPTSLITNALWGTNIIAANTMVVGRTYRLSARGYMTSVSAAICETGVRMNNNTLLCTNLFAFGTSLVNDWFSIDADITVRSVGASGSVLAVGLMSRQTSSGSSSVIGSVRLWNGLLATPVTVDTTVDQVFDLYVDPGATTHGFTITSCTLQLSD